MAKRKKSSVRKTRPHRKHTKRKGARRRRGLGDLFADRVRERLAKIPHPTAAATKRARTMVREQLCAEDHYQYCDRKRAGKASDLEAAFANMTPRELEGHVEKSEAKAEKKGCVAPKGKTCVDAFLAKKPGNKGKGKLRKGCYANPRAPGTYVCKDAVLKRLEHNAASPRKAAKKAAKKAGRKHSAKKHHGGLVAVPLAKAVTKAGKFKKGCSFKRGKVLCKK